MTNVANTLLPITVTVARDGGGTAVYRLRATNLNKVLKYIILCGGQLQSIEPAESPS